MPTIQGEKSPSERFAGAEKTFTIEALMQNGWALQSGTSHFLGQSFARAFDVRFQNEKKERELVWATSWGVSTRLIGGMIMTHSDDKGLVLPPKLAPHHIVVIPILAGGKETDERTLLEAEGLVSSLRSCGLRVTIDSRDYVRPGAKFFEWERKGVPIRLEIGPKDILNRQVTAVCRHDGIKTRIVNDADLPNHLKSTLEDIQNAMLRKAQENLNRHIHRPSSYNQMKQMLSSSDPKEKGFYLVPWKCDAANEKFIKDDCKATIRCYPFDLQSESKDAKCFFSGDSATHMALFARAY